MPYHLRLVLVVKCINANLFTLNQIRFSLPNIEVPIISYCGLFGDGEIKLDHPHIIYCLLEYIIHYSAIL